MRLPKIWTALRGASCVLAAWLFLGTGTANAALLGLTLADFPDIFSSFINVAYDHVTDQFTATGFSLQFDDDGSVPAENVVGGSFSIVADILSNGAIGPGGGTIVIGGTIPTLVPAIPNGGTLLTGNLTAFGFQDTGGDPFEFLFQVTGGELASIYGGIGATVGTILTADGGSTFTGSFTVDFENDAFTGLSNTAVPEPSTLLLVPMVGEAMTLVLGVGVGCVLLFELTRRTQLGA